jgi:hypothetical protein
MQFKTTAVNPIDYEYGPRSVAIGDFNNDFRLDIAVANFGTNNVGIFLGFDNGSFVSQIEVSTGASRPIAICLVDFDNDTRLDIGTAS